MHELSVIMPVYKEPVNVLEQSIDSVLQQTYKHFEFVIVTEPNEANASFFESVQKSDCRVKVIRNQNRLGVAATRNRAINACSGKYISFVDADDYSSLSRFEKQLNFLENNLEVSVVGSNMHLVDEKNNIVGERIYPELYNDIKRAFLLTMPLANPTVMVRSKDLKEIGLFDSRLVKSEDFELWLRFLARNKKIYNLQENLLYYRIPANEKRPKIHWINNYVARKRFGKYIWPWHQRMISLSAYCLISHAPPVLLNNILDLKVANKIKKISKY
jgi:glycosyltransferase involved in cell wall biosynthesis